MDAAAAAQEEEGEKRSKLEPAVTEAVEAEKQAETNIQNAQGASANGQRPTEGWRTNTRDERERERARARARYRLEKR